jgi:hypothetical protein
MTEFEELRKRVTEQAADADPAGRAALEHVLAELDPDPTARPGNPDRMTPGQVGRKTGKSLALTGFGAALAFWGVFALVIALAEKSIAVAVVGALMVAAAVPMLRSGIRNRSQVNEEQRRYREGH